MEFYTFFVNFFRQGGVFLYPIALVFAVGVAIAIERFIYLTKETIGDRNLWDDLVPYLQSGNFKQAVVAHLRFERVDRHRPEVRHGPHLERAQAR